MFVPLRISTAEINRLQSEVGELTIPDIKEKGESFYNELLQRCNGKDGTIDGSDLLSLNFPFDKDNYDVFISHSHNDKDIALFLYAWLTRCGLTCFIDEVLWYSADALLRHIDNVYCRSEKPRLIDYNKSLYSSSHVHTMLSMSILEAIDRSECCLFVRSNNSVTLRDGIENKTLSPWIYQEVQYVSHIQLRIPPRLHDASIRLFSARTGGRILCERKDDGQLKIEYAIDLSSFTDITGEDLLNLQRTGVSGLDDIYNKYVKKNRDGVKFRPKYRV